MIAGSNLHSIVGSRETHREAVLPSGIAARDGDALDGGDNRRERHLAPLHNISSDHITSVSDLIRSTHRRVGPGHVQRASICNQILGVISSKKNRTGRGVRLLLGLERVTAGLNAIASGMVREDADVVRGTHLQTSDVVECIAELVGPGAYFVRLELRRCEVGVNIPLDTPFVDANTVARRNLEINQGRFASEGLLRIDTGIGGDQQGRRTGQAAGQNHEAVRLGALVHASIASWCAALSTFQIVGGRRDLVGVVLADILEPAGAALSLIVEGANTNNVISVGGD